MLLPRAATGARGRDLDRLGEIGDSQIRVFGAPQARLKELQ
jgi:hypothetical protein